MDPAMDPAQAPPPTCYRHPDRATYVRCTRCNRYICPECMRDASVGHQCPDCVGQGAPTARVRVGVQRPLLTYGLIALNVVMFVLQSASSEVQGSLVTSTPAVADGQWYRLLSSAFLHYGITHILFNMWALYVVGAPLESALGRLRYGVLYVMSAVGGSVLVYLLSPLHAATAGASGAVFGLFGATFVIGRKLRLDVRWVVILIAINLVITFTIPGISWQGHIGGLVTGAVIAAAFVYTPSRPVHAGATVTLLALFAVLIWWRTADLLATFAY
jgi:membrane associated rhomboid family serine protease